MSSAQETPSLVWQEDGNTLMLVRPAPENASCDHQLAAPGPRPASCKLGCTRPGCTVDSPAFGSAV